MIMVYQSLLALLFLASLSSAQYGAKLEPMPGKIIHGVGQSTMSSAAWVKVKDYEKAMGSVLAPAIDKTYMSLATYLGTRRPYRKNFQSYLTWVASTGKIPEVGINMLPDKDIASGKFDAEVRQFGKDIKAFGKPVFLRLGVEIANAWNAYTPGVFPVAWRRIVDIIRKEGAHNAAFVWCIAAAGFSTFADFDAQGKGIWYPGDEYVDWMGLDLFNALDFTPGLHKSYLNSVALCEFAKRRKKPVMIAECTAKGLRLTAAGSASSYWKTWFGPFFAFLDKYPVIRSFHYINWDWSKTRKWPTWGNADITVNSALLKLYKKELSKAKYLHKPTKKLFPNPWPRQGYLIARGKIATPVFENAKVGAHAFLILSAQRILTNPKAAPKMQDFGLLAGTWGYLKLKPDYILYLGKVPGTGLLSMSFPAQVSRMTVYFQCLAGLQLSGELRADL